MLAKFYIPQILLTLICVGSFGLFMYYMIQPALFTTDTITGKKIECNHISVYFNGKDPRVLEYYAAKVGGNVLYYEKKFELYQIGFRWHCSSEYMHEMVNAFLKIPGVREAYVNTAGDKPLPTAL